MTSVEQPITTFRLVHVWRSKIWTVNMAKHRSYWMLPLYKLNLAYTYLSFSVLLLLKKKKRYFKSNYKIVKAFLLWLSCHTQTVLMQKQTPRKTSLCKYFLKKELPVLLSDEMQPLWHSYTSYKHVGPESSSILLKSFSLKWKWLPHLHS